MASTRKARTSRSAPTTMRASRPLGAIPDKVDFRDWIYQPTLAALPPALNNTGGVPLVLDQGTEGACTGFALAAVVNFLTARRGIRKIASARMLYEMARRYDEWPGDQYEGSSARGTMKGWVTHGVCTESIWPNDLHGRQHFTGTIEKAARDLPGGAYYRVKHRQIRDIHAAINETGILYATLMVHAGWDDPSKPTDTVPGGASFKKSLKIPVIRRVGRATGCHAVAVVGYNTNGLIVQNSWGPAWGKDGFALLPYEDFLLHSTDVWVAQLGVPVSPGLWVEENAADTTSGQHRVSAAVKLEEIRPYIINIGNNGRLSTHGRYWSSPERIAEIFDREIPAATKGWAKKRIMLFLHGGLNSEDASARRVKAFMQPFLRNEVYPLHIMWQTGGLETIANLIKDVFTEDDQRAASWFRDFREGLTNAKDFSLEATFSRPGTAMWNEMKENARLASAPGGAMETVLQAANTALDKVPPNNRHNWELHIVAHSAGAIFTTHLLPILAGLRHLTVKSVHFLAPAVRVDDFKSLYLAAHQAGSAPLPTLYVLDDEAEQDDHVAKVYGKSLLYFVSNAFEGKRGTPLLGMNKFIESDPALAALFPTGVRRFVASPASQESRSTSHGGFDEDVFTVNHVLKGMLGHPAPHPVVPRDLDHQ